MGRALEFEISDFRFACAWGLLALAGGFLAGGLWAAEPRAATAEEVPLFDFKKEEESRAGAKEGFRDPFTYWRELPQQVGGVREGEPPPDIAARLIKDADDARVVAQERLKNQLYPKCIEACDKGLESLSKVPDLASRADLQQRQELFYRLRRAAERLQKRAEAEAAFRNLNLRISGIIAKEYRSLAVVNGRIVTRGSLIDLPDPSEGAVYVDEIQPNRLVVRFRGYRIELPVR